MDINDLRSLITVLSFITFLGIVWWAYGMKSNKKRFEEASMLPFSDEEADQVELGLDRKGQRKTS
ncbi:MAG TPA: cbb3-type cytochrome c oxidase subunit 3 [Accumulibacter sp.]|nr:cbb3-type cytochrome c oxidase subunit 3 [Accumulibacter sp.]HMW16362.1 cbb3-type cytochrome c oxidase subunit 3 [Accumulibacter sp.]HMX22229.1 cbb3-type cytochrome c oxidase subunit 3 [Accumulibacter sp.]HNC17373.1 cbb3-type cytochrome c oxidase subunit 3 [Accumulibacter sp.]HND78890.1 cbb3-type cytochrome c oxidase subunit 3 [Accumulibacter sp.]